MDFKTSSEVDTAHYILMKNGAPMYYKDLVMEVIKKKHKPVQSLSNAIAEVYTLINMDSRFHFEGKNEEGKSMWGLTEWIPPEVKRGHSSSQTKSSSASTKTNHRREKLLEEIQEGN